jgi:hypothetical protein
MDRNANRDAGAAYRRALGQPDNDPGLSAPGYRTYVDEFFTMTSVHAISWRKPTG